VYKRQGPAHADFDTRYERELPNVSMIADAPPTECKQSLMSLRAFADMTLGKRANGGSAMPKRAWCNECRALVILTEDGLCPNGHPKPALMGVEEVAYATQPTERAPHVAEAAVLGGRTRSGSLSYGGYGSASQPPGEAEVGGTFTAGGLSAQPLGALESPAGAIALDNPWQAGVNSYGIDPELQAKLDADMACAKRDVPWTESWAAIIVFLLFFWPVGIVFLWRSSVPATSVKWGITGVFAALVTFNIIRVMLAYQATMSAMQVAHP
jgi:hypothetical protein